MLQSTVINKLAMELAIANGDLDHLHNNRIYIQMALTIGIEHFNILQEEIVVLDKDGIEAGRFKSVSDAAKELGINQSNISQCLMGIRHSAGGLMFMKTRDYELIKRTPYDGESVTESKPKANLI
jgi:hypothetical protein